MLEARVYKFGNIGPPFVSPRPALGLKLGPDHVVTGSGNHAFRAPSAIKAFMVQTVVVPVDLRGLALRPFLSAFVLSGLTGADRAAALRDPEGALDATTSAPFALTTRALGGSIRFASGAPCAPTSCRSRSTPTRCATVALSARAARRSAPPSS